MAFKSRRGQCTHSFVQFRYLCSEWINHFPVIVLISAEFASVAVCPNFFHKMTLSRFFKADGHTISRLYTEKI